VPVLTVSAARQATTVDLNNIIYICLPASRAALVGGLPDKFGRPF
jgi:hypothetical protein